MRHPQAAVVPAGNDRLTAELHLPERDALLDDAPPM